MVIGLELRSGEQGKVIKIAQKQKGIILLVREKSARDTVQTITSPNLPISLLCSPVTMVKLILLN